MTVYGRLIAALLMAAGLAGCGVAVDQRTLAPVVSAAAPAQTPEADPAAETADSATAIRATASPVPDADKLATDQANKGSERDGSAKDGVAGDETELASLAPSAATSIDELVASIPDTDPDAPAVAMPPPPSSQVEKDPVPAASVSAPAIPPVAPPPAEPAQPDKSGANDVVGDIIWNLESAMKSRPPAPSPPKIPVGPDPSLASEALEAAFALLARRDLGLPDDAFVMPRKRPGMTRIALLVPLTGDAATLGAELQRGAELALFSVRNPALELLVFDTHEAGAGMAAKRAAAAEADLVVGPLFSDAVVAARAVLAPASIPMLALSNNVQIANSGSWLLGYVPEQQIDLLLAHALTTGRGKVGIIAEDTAFGQRLAGHAAKRLAQFGLRPEVSMTLGATVLADEDSLKASVRNFTGYVAPADDEETPAFADLPPARFDALLFAGSADFALRTAPVLAYYDADPERVLYLGTTQWNQQRILNEPSLQGGVYTFRPTGRDDSFNSLWSAAWRSSPGALARLSFDAMAMAAVLAGQQRGLWQASLESGSGFSGFSGAYRLLPGGGNQRAFELRQIEGGVSRILQPAPDKI